MTFDRGAGDGRVRGAESMESGCAAPFRGVGGRLGSRGKAVLGGGVVAGAFALGLVAGGGFLNDVEAQSSLTGRAEFATLEETWELIHDPQAFISYVAAETRTFLEER